jgi:HK97 family phage portal protein
MEEEIPLPPGDVIHLKALTGSDPDLGLSPIRVARETLAAAIAAEEYGARFFSNDARPGLVVRWPGAMDEHQQRQFKLQWDSGHRGVQRSHLVGVLTAGAEIEQVGLAPEDAQLVELRRFSVEEICRIFRVPPYLLADLQPGSVSYASVEQQSIDFVVHSLRPWLVRLEQELTRKLFTTLERRRGLYVQFVVDGLLRGDTASRYRAYDTGRRGGWLSANDIRELEDMPIIEGGDTYLQPAGTTPIGENLEAELDRLLEQDDRGKGGGRGR